jgi:hypothetical protein
LLPGDGSKERKGKEGRGKEGKGGERREKGKTRRGKKQTATISAELSLSTKAPLFPGSFHLDK